MVTRGALTDSMAIGYRPVCESKPGLWPCFPLMPRFGLMGLGRVNPVIPRYGLTGLTFDGTGLLGTGIFGSGSWDWSEWLVLGIGAYALFSMFHQTKRTASAARQSTLKASSALGRRRKTRAQKLRAKAKRLEERRGFFESALFGSEA